MPEVAESLDHALEERIAALGDWLSENAPEIQDDQRHLDDGTTERAYWHYGYMAALRDIQNCLPGKNRRAN